MKVKVSQATRLITACIKSGLVAMLAGSPGIGKSAIAHNIADEWKLKVIDLRLSQCDPTDLLGFPNIIGKKAGYVPMETFPMEGDLIPDGFNGWLLLLDEFNSAAPAVQAAAYKLILDRMVGVYNLHKNVAIMCAGNLETDNAIVQPMSTALQSRLIHMELIIDHEEWIDWATSAEIDHRITDYIKFKPGNLYSFKPDHTDHTYACPRTWNFLSKLILQVPVDSKDALPLYAGAVSEGIAREFIGFTKIYDSLPKMAAIVASPETVVIPNEPSILYALTGSLSHNANKDNLSQLMKYVTRLPVEFQVVTLRETVRRNKPLMGHPAIQKWVSESSAKLF